MNIKAISRINLQRALIWHVGGLEEWSAADWSNAMAGEAGEVCNAVKKYRRLEMGIQQAAGPQNFDAAIAKIAEEIGDTYLYLDLLAQRLGIDLSEAIVNTFNRVSVREGFPQRLALPPTAIDEESIIMQGFCNNNDAQHDGFDCYKVGFIDGQKFANGELP